MSAKLTEHSKAALRLLGRSPKDQDGWAKVSAVVWPLLGGVPPELMEREGDDQNGGRARFTETGEAVYEFSL